MSAFFHVLELLMISASVLLAITLIMVFVISRLPKHNPLRLILGLIARRMGLTIGGLMLIPPESTIPVVGEIGDLVTIALVIYYWTTLKKDLVKIDFSSLIGGNADGVNEPRMKRVN